MAGASLPKAANAPRLASKMLASLGAFATDFPYLRMLKTHKLLLETGGFFRPHRRVTSTVRVRTDAGQLAAFDNQILVADGAVFEVAL